MMSFFKSLFSRGRGSGVIEISADQQLLLERAEASVRRYLRKGQEFPFFVLMLRSDGDIASYVPSEEFTNEKDAFAGLLQSLLSQARFGMITANAIVTPMDPQPGQTDRLAIFDLEHSGSSRVIARLPYRQNGSAVEFGEMTFERAPPKLFAPLE